MFSVSLRRSGLPKTLRYTVERIMLAGFQMSHSDGLRGSSYNHHMFTCTVYKCFNLHAYALIYNKSWHTGIGAVSKKLEIEHIWPTVLTWFLSQKCSKIQIFRGSAPDPTGGAHSASFIAPQTSSCSGGKGQGTRCSIPNNPTPVLGLSIRPRFYGSQGQTHYKVVHRKYDY